MFKSSLFINDEAVRYFTDIKCCLSGNICYISDGLQFESKLLMV